MKIGFVFDDSLDKSDGVQQYILTLGEWLSTNGHEVHYLVGQTKRVDKPNIHSMAKNVRVRFNHNNLSVPLPASKSAIRKHFAEHTYDVLHVQLPYSPQLAERIILNAPESTAIVGTFHILPFSFKEKFGTRSLAKVLYRSLPRFDEIVSVSAPAKDFALKYFHVKSNVIPNPVDVSRFSMTGSHKRSGDCHIVFLGRLVDRKGVMQLLQAVAALTRQNTRNFKVTIAGTGPLNSKVDAFVKKHSLESLVHCTGYLDEEDKPKLLNSADIAVFPSLGGESFGIVLTEAMAAGAGVVIGGNNLGYSSVLEHEDVLFDPNKIQEFTAVLNNLLADTNARRLIHGRQQKQIKSYDISVVGRSVEQMYKDAIAKHSKHMNNGK